MRIAERNGKGEMEKGGGEKKKKKENTKELLTRVIYRALMTECNFTTPIN